MDIQHRSLQLRSPPKGKFNISLLDIQRVAPSSLIFPGDTRFLNILYADIFIMPVRKHRRTRRLRRRTRGRGRRALFVLGFRLHRFAVNGPPCLCSLFIHCASSSTHSAIAGLSDSRITTVRLEGTNDNRQSVRPLKPGFFSRRIHSCASVSHRGTAFYDSQESLALRMKNGCTVEQ